MIRNKKVIFFVFLIFFSFSFFNVLAQEDNNYKKENKLILELSKVDYDSNSVENFKNYMKNYHEKTIQSLENKKGVKVTSSSWLGNYIVINLNESILSREKVESFPNVTNIRNISKYKAPEIDLSRSLKTYERNNYSYGLKDLNVPTAWKKYNQGGGVDITVLDTGVNTSTIGINNIEWIDFAGSKEKPTDWGVFGHGTLVSSILIGEDNSGKHIGVVPKADLTVGRVCNDKHICYETDIIKGLELSLVKGADVISLSLGSNSMSNNFIDATQRASRFNTTVVAAIGNRGKNKSAYPGNYYNVISVGSVGQDGRISDFSSGEIIKKSEFNSPFKTRDWPEKYIVPDVVAPGEDITVPSIGGNTFYKSEGTSLATPYITGIVAMMIKQNNYEKNTEKIKTILQQTSKKPSGISEKKDIRYGYGVPNASKAIKLYSKETEKITGRVINKNSGVKNAKILFNNMTVYADKKGFFNFYSLETTEYIKISKTGYHKKRINIKNITKNNQIEMKEKNLEILLDDFENPPKNTKEIHPYLYEDLNGDGNGTGLEQTVKVYSKLIREKSLNLNNQTAEALNWNKNSPKHKVTISDMVTLFGYQIRYNN